MKQLIFLVSILYVLSPIDLVPEGVIGRFGLLDDIVVMTVLYLYFKSRPAGSGARQRVTGDNEGQEKKTEPPPEKDPYKVLGVARDASAGEIKHAYRELANKYHPDKVSHLGDEFREIANKRFKEIDEAYQELTPK